MVYDELEMLQALHHPGIVHFVDWFESKVCLSARFVISKLTKAGQILHCHSTGHGW